MQKEKLNNIVVDGEISHKDINSALVNVNKKFTFTNRLKFINIMLILVFVILSSRVSYLAFNKVSLSSIFTFNESDNASVNGLNVRRDIIDREGIPIASSLKTFDLYVNAKDIMFNDRTARALIKIFPEFSYDDLMKKFKSGKTFIYLKRQIPLGYKDAILRIGDPGLKFKNSYDRFYPMDNLFSHVIGSVDIDNRGISGVEKGLSKEILSDNPKPLQLSVDTRIQTAIRDILYEGLKKYDAKSASAILMDIHTGEVLALVSLPDFSPTNIVQTLNNPIYNNHITTDVYEQGSVFKVFTTSLAIENGYADLDPIPVYDISKPYKIGNFSISDHLIKEKTIKFSDILVKSSNIVAARVSVEMGIEKQREFFKKLHIFDRIVFPEIPELSYPIIPSVKRWKEDTTATAGYGYGLSVTPLHTILAFNSLVNNGLYIYPTLIKQTPQTIEERKEAGTFQSPIRTIKRTTSNLLRRWLRLTVTKGKENYKDVAGIKIGGKTGTSDKLIDGRYNTNLLRTFYLITFPIENPKYSMMVMVDEAKKGPCLLSGCNVLPLTKEILKNIAVYLKLD